MSQRVMKILVGLPGSGKTRYATELMDVEPDQWFRVNWDEMRGDDYHYSRENENRIKQESENLVRDIVARTNKNIIIDNTNLNGKTSDRWVNLARELDLRTQFCFMPANIDECVRRDARRVGRARVGRAVIERMALSAGVIPFPEDKKLVLVDVDGTLADLTHRLHFVKSQCHWCEGSGLLGNGIQLCTCCNGTKKQKKDWPRFFFNCKDDKPFPVVVDWVKAIHADPDYMVCIVSGRPIDKCGDETVAWLEKHGVPFHRIFMRNSGDKRDDTIVKKEILDKLPKQQIAWVIDDRQRVCDMWRANGLKVYQVAEGNF